MHKNNTHGDIEVVEGIGGSRKVGEIPLDVLAIARKLETSENGDENAPGCMEDFVQESKQGIEQIFSYFKEQYNKLTWAESWEIAMTRLPPLRWIPEYTFEKFQYDLTVILMSSTKLCFQHHPTSRQAGLIVGCMLIPQSMAYAALAGLPAINGLYTGFSPLIVYCFLGVSRQVSVWQQLSSCLCFTLYASRVWLC